MRRLGILALFLVLILVGVQPASAACGRITIAEMTWGSAAIAAHVQKFILNKGYGCKAELVPGDTVPTVTSMSEKGEPDIAPEIWINSARAVIERAVRDGRLKITSDILPEGGQEGWWIPDYVAKAHPELTTLQAVMKRPDLFPDKEEPGKGRFYTCPAGWGCQIANANLFKAYGLKEAGFTAFDPGSGEGLAAAIAKAYERRQPIFTYYWAPTAVLGKYPLVRLDGMKHDPATWKCIIDPGCADPKPNMYPAAEVLSVVTTRFAKAAPEALGFVAKFSWPINVVNALLAWKDETRANAAETATHFLKNFQPVWKAWVPAQISTKVKAALPR
ncbi:MAG: ABC transporter substrate-binding protein [Rhodospirillales bacterium]|nr:ABC transporter substrate-binding protein [Rhodospirillales bacterium]